MKTSNKHSRFPQLIASLQEHANHACRNWLGHGLPDPVIVTYGFRSGGGDFAITHRTIRHDRSSGDIHLARALDAYVTGAGKALVSAFLDDQKIDKWAYDHGYRGELSFRLDEPGLLDFRFFERIREEKTTRYDIKHLLGHKGGGTGIDLQGERERLNKMKSELTSLALNIGVMAGVAYEEAAGSELPKDATLTIKYQGDAERGPPTTGVKLNPGDRKVEAEHVRFMLDAPVDWARMMTVESGCATVRDQLLYISGRPDWLGFGGGCGTITLGLYPARILSFEHTDFRYHEVPVEDASHTAAPAEICEETIDTGPEPGI